MSPRNSFRLLFRTRESEFRAIDQELDRAVSGPVWLKDSRVAEAVIEMIKHGQTDLELFDLHAFVVMANHVHLLITANVDIARITKGI